MEAIEYLRQRERMCKAEGMQPSAGGCPGECDLDFYIACNMVSIESKNPAEAVEIVRRWAEANPVEGGIKLTAMERRFVQIYIDKGYIWAAREKSGYLVLFKRCPERVNDGFVDTSPRHGSRGVLGDLLLSVTWENSPVLLPKLLEV